MQEKRAEPKKFSDSLPIETMTADTLVKFQREYAKQIPLTKEQAKLLLNYQEGAGYYIGQSGSAMLRGDSCEKKGEIVWEEYSLDDLIDSSLEWNYEMILDMEVENINAENPQDFGEKQQEYDALKEDETVLDRLFDQTQYGISMNRTAEQMAEKLLHELEQGEPIDTVVEKMVGEIKVPEKGGRSR